MPPISLRPTIWITKNNSIMSADTRRFPESNSSRLTALLRAKQKSGSMGAASLLSLGSQTRLGQIHTDYTRAVAEVNKWKDFLFEKTNEKTNARRALQTMVSHFVQVFNMRVTRGVFAPTDRTFYDIKEYDASVPTMSNINEILTMANHLIAGDELRVGRGGAPMAMPTIGEVKALFDEFCRIGGEHDALTQEYKTAKAALSALNIEADVVIQKVWDEVKAHYSEESPDTQREKALQWGVVCVRLGSTKTITGTVTDKATGAPLVGVSVKLENDKPTVTTGCNGSFTLTTQLMNEQILSAMGSCCAEYACTINLEEDQNINLQIFLEKLI